MGFREFFRKTFLLTFRWSEPALYRLRLRDDFAVRVGMMLAVWAAGAGVLFGLFAVNSGPPALARDIALGAGLGLCPVILLMLFGRKHAGGTIFVQEDFIRRQRSYGGLSGQWLESVEWPYAAIERCIIVPGRELGKSFSVMVLSVGSEIEIVGIPTRVDMKKLARYLASKGVAVKPGQSVPRQFRKALDRRLATGVAVAGAVLLCGGLAGYASRFAAAEAQPAGPLAMEDVRPDPFQPNLLKELGDRRPAESPPRARVSPDAASDADPNARAALDPEPPAPPRFPRPTFGLNDSNSNRREPETSPVPDSPPLATTPADRTPSPSRETPPAAEQQPGDTELVGGSGGGAFRITSPTGEPLIGFRYSLGRWAGQPAIARFEPLFRRDAAAGRGESVLAREGYAVGALKVDAPKYVSAVQIVFMRVQADDRLDPSDSYTSDWIGSPSDAPPKTLGGTGAKVVGLHGRRAAILDAVGLVLDEP